MVQAALAPMGVAVKGTDDIGIQITIIEDGVTAQDNARKKSLIYARAASKPVLSIDNALYLDGLSDDEQPGVNTRTVPGIEGRASDEELLHYYSQRVARLGGSIDGRWEFALCIADEASNFVERTIISPRRFVSVPSKSLLPGYPLESIQIEPRTGRYISDMTTEEQDVFWQDIIGGQLRDFLDDARASIPGIFWDAE